MDGPYVKGRKSFRIDIGIGVLLVAVAFGNGGMAEAKASSTVWQCRLEAYACEYNLCPALFVAIQTEQV